MDPVRDRCAPAATTPRPVSRSRTPTASTPRCSIRRPASPTRTSVNGRHRVPPGLHPGLQRLAVRVLLARPRAARGAWPCSPTSARTRPWPSSSGPWRCRACGARSSASTRTATRPSSPRTTASGRAGRGRHPAVDPRRLRHRRPPGDKAASWASRRTVRFFDAPIRITQFIETGVFDRFPELDLVLVEIDSAWLPYVTEQMDDRFHRAAATNRPDIKRLPSEYFQRQHLHDLHHRQLRRAQPRCHRRRARCCGPATTRTAAPTGPTPARRSTTTSRACAADREAILAGNAQRLYLADRTA